MNIVDFSQKSGKSSVAIDPKLCYPRSYLIPLFNNGWAGKLYSLYVRCQAFELIVKSSMCLGEKNEKSAYGILYFAYYTFRLSLVESGGGAGFQRPEFAGQK